MKRIILSILVVLAFSMSTFAQVDKIVGRWKTIDDKDGSEKSIIHIFKATNGKYYGKIEHLFKDADKLCTECEGTFDEPQCLKVCMEDGCIEYI